MRLTKSEGNGGNMAYIKVIEENQASEELKEIYNKVKSSRGKISNIIKVHSLLPDTMKTHLDLYKSIMFSKSSLSRADKELIAIVVSSVNRCEYCVSHHARALLFYWKDEAKVNRAIEDFRKLDLTNKQLAMLNYAEKLTLSPHKITEDDIKACGKLALMIKIFWALL